MTRIRISDLIGFVVPTFIALILAVFIWLGWQHFDHSLHLIFADDQTSMFEEMRVKALGSDPTGAANCLEYAVNYYPSDTKQQAGSKFDRIVERQRSSAIREIINHLRAKTSEDLGDGPQPWIKKFAHH